MPDEKEEGKLFPDWIIEKIAADMAKPLEAYRAAMATTALSVGEVTKSYEKMKAALLPFGTVVISPRDNRAAMVVGSAGDGWITVLGLRGWPGHEPGDLFDVVGTAIATWDIEVHNPNVPIYWGHEA